LSIFVAAIVSGGADPLNKLLLACISGSFITIAANTINDFYDFDIDQINRPKRPLPAGLLTQKEAFVFSIVSFVLGIIVSFFINSAAVIIAVFFSALLYLYSSYFKRTAIWGNFIVSLATAFAFIYGGLAVNRFTQAIFPAIFAFLMHFGREIIKDMEDAEGDKLNNAETLPIKFGFLTAKWFVTVIFILLFFATIFPFSFNIYGKWYFYIVMLGVNTVLLFSTFSMWKFTSRENLRKLSALLKADMFVGLIAIYAGRF
jgi:geranylgeranylglycerol-phosphate geranylgeranyltransferase